MIREKDIETLVPLNRIVKQAVLDTYGDFVKDEARYTAWAVRGLKKLSTEALKSGKRFAILNVNKNLNSAILPCDFKEELFVGFINDCGQKIPLNINSNIVNPKLIESVPCENECDKKCGCYPKQMCEDLHTTQVINKIVIGDTEYDETVTTTYQPNGEIYVITTTPYVKINGGGIEYVTRKEYQTVLDIADCGCIEKTERNAAKIEAINPDVYCCYCTGCNTGNTDFGGYRIFKENNTIVFDKGMRFDKVYMEYRGFLPKSGNEYLVPEIAFECLINFIKFKSVENRKGVSMNDRAWHWERYLVERGNMTKVLGRMRLADIIHSALTVPTFDYNKPHCVTSRSIETGVEEKTIIITNTVNVPSSSSSSSGCNPAIITTNGAEMLGGITYSNSRLIGIPFRIFANPFNRFLTSSEFTVLPTGGFTILTGTYGLDDQFDIFPKWCEANIADIPVGPVDESDFPFMLDSDDFEDDGVTILDDRLVGNEITIFVNEFTQQFLTAPTYFTYVPGGIQLNSNLFDANTNTYTIRVDKLNS